jgi:hypothetical protein
MAELTIDQCLAAGKKGVFISNEHYHALPGISGTNFVLLKESNRHLDYKKLFKLGDTDATKFGSLVHAMVLEPDTVQNTYVVMPKFGTKAVTGKSIVQAEADFKIDNKGKTIVEFDDFRKATRMAENVRAICAPVLERGIKERSLFTKVDGLTLKCRLDIDDEENGDDWDIKTITLGIKEFSDSVLKSHIHKYRYHWSAAFRQIVRRNLGLPVRNAYLIFVNSGPGHMVRIIKFSDAWLESATAEVNEMLSRRRAYEEMSIDDSPITELTWEKNIAE